MEPGNRPPRYDGLVVEPQDLCQAPPHLFWRQRDPSQQRTCLREGVANEGAFIERRVVIAKRQEGSRRCPVTSLTVSSHGANDRRGVEPPGQTHANGNVTPQTDSDCIFEQLRECFLDVCGRLRLEAGERPVGPLAPVAIEPELEGASRWDLLDAGVEGCRGLVQPAVNEELGRDLPVRFSCIEARSQYGFHL